MTWITPKNWQDWLLTIIIGIRRLIQQHYLPCHP